MSTITLQQDGRRTYILGDTYPHRDAIRAIGAHWDPDRKAWWTGKHADAEALVARLTSSSAAGAVAPASSQREAPGEDAVVAGKAEYKGKTYYIAGRVDRGRTRFDDRVVMVATKDGAKVLLYSRDGTLQFWAPVEQFGHRISVSAPVPDGVARVVKQYARPTTIAKLRAFADEVRREGSAELVAAKRRGWDGAIGSPSYYSSGAFDELDL